jgi:hypothetical protein
MDTLLIALGLSACLVGSIFGLAPVISALLTGQFIEGPYQEPIPIRSQPGRFARFAFLGLFLGGSFVAALDLMVGVILGS